MLDLAQQRTISLALPPDDASRVRLATRGDTPMAVLRLLADDPAVVVRAAVALNPAYDAATSTQLRGDPDERVRAVLAGKVARLLPSLSGQEQRAALAHAHDTLLTLANDAATRVRAALAEVLHAMPQAPRAVIMRLAQDPVISISEPVLRLSPLLADADLLEILAAPPHPAAAQAVAGRLRLSSTVSGAIAAQADGAAVRTLLQNDSAMIREGTLDGLIGRACDHPDWHEPLVQRPFLAEHASRALSMIVTGHLLDKLSQRADLPAAVADEIRARMAALPAPSVLTDKALMSQAQRQHECRPFHERDLVEAAVAGESRRVAIILAVTSHMPLDRIDRSVKFHNVKGLVSLAWRAGFSMRAAQLVQSTLGPFVPGETLAPAQHGSFPLCADEMEWQVEALANPAG